MPVVMHHWFRSPTHISTERKYPAIRNKNLFVQKNGRKPGETPKSSLISGAHRENVIGSALALRCNVGFLILWSIQAESIAGLALPSRTTTSDLPRISSWACTQ